MKIGIFELIGSIQRDIKPLPSLDERLRADDSIGEPVDVFIPVLEKDLPLLNFCVSGLRHNLNHPIGQIFIIAPPSKALEAGARDLDICLLDENDVLPELDRNRIQFVSKTGESRRGWILQQLLKLAADSLTKQDYFFVIDADTVLTRKQKFTLDGKNIFLQNPKIRKEYFYANRRLLGFGPCNYWSFVSHQMLFKRDWLADMKLHIEQNCSQAWYDAIIGNLESKKGLGFSEFELYGNWCLQNYPDEVLCVDWEHLDVKQVDKQVALVNDSFYRSVSCHSYHDGR